MTATNTRTRIPLTLRRPANDRELNFCRNAWTAGSAKYRPARVWWSNEGYANRIEQMSFGMYVNEHRRYVDALADYITIACPAERANVIAGFVCVRGDELHWAYTAYTFRRFGVAARLLEEYITRPMKIMSWAPVLEHLPRPSNWVYNEVAKWQ